MGKSWEKYGKMVGKWHGNRDLHGFTILTLPSFGGKQKPGGSAPGVFTVVTQEKSVNL